MRSPRWAPAEESAPSRCRVIAQCVSAGLLITLTACASGETAKYGAVQNPPLPSDTPPAYVAKVHVPSVEVELDGLPVQLAPRQRSHIPDDPREPWSPNYGSIRPSRTSDMPAPIPIALAVGKPASLFRPEPPDEDEIIRRAITEHEMRQED